MHAAACLCAGCLLEHSLLRAGQLTVLTADGHDYSSSPQSQQRCKAAAHATCTANTALLCDTCHSFASKSTCGLQPAKLAVDRLLMCRQAGHFSSHMQLSVVQQRGHCELLHTLGCVHVLSSPHHVWSLQKDALHKLYCQQRDRESSECLQRALSIHCRGQGQPPFNILPLPTCVLNHTHTNTVHRVPSSAVQQQEACHLPDDADMSQQVSAQHGACVVSAARYRPEHRRVPEHQLGPPAYAEGLMNSVTCFRKCTCSR